MTIGQRVTFAHKEKKILAKEKHNAKKTPSSLPRSLKEKDPKKSATREWKWDPNPEYRGSHWHKAANHVYCNENYGWEYPDCTICNPVPRELPVIVPGKPGFGPRRKFDQLEALCQDDDPYLSDDGEDILDDEDEDVLAQTPPEMSISIMDLARPAKRKDIARTYDFINDTISEFSFADEEDEEWETIPEVHPRRPDFATVVKGLS